MELVTRYELPRGKVATDTPIYGCVDCLELLRQYGGWGIHHSSVPTAEATMPCGFCGATDKTAKGRSR